MGFSLEGSACADGRAAQPMVRHIAPWTLGRYSEWIMSEAAGTAVMEATLRAILERMRDPVKKVALARLLRWCFLK